MKIGDKVRFLNEVGGGVVAGFRDKQTVLVTDDSGFDIPVLVSDVVVIDTDDYNLERKPAPAPQTPASAQRPKHPDTYIEHKEEDIADKPITFRPKPLERRGGDVLNLFLAFVPAGVVQQGSVATAERFEAYLVNDSNYYLQFVLMKGEGRAYAVRHGGLVEPNTKLLLETFRHEQLPEWERLAFQGFAYKQDHSFLLKPTLDVALRIEGAKFYKLHTFVENDFFDEAALLFDIVRDDQPARTLCLDPATLKRAMVEKQDAPRPTRQPARKTDPNEPLVVDLHADELLETTAGMQPKDILDYQLRTVRETLDAHQRHRGTRIVFIHGKGNGVLRQEIIKELRAHYKAARYQDASFQKYGFGATLVIL